MQEIVGRYTRNIKLREQVQHWLVSALFLLYRKVLKSSKIVYNGFEIKNCMTKERRGLRHDVVYEIFVSVVWLHYLTVKRSLSDMDLSISHDLSITFK